MHEHREGVASPRTDLCCPFPILNFCLSTVLGTKLIQGTYSLLKRRKRKGEKSKGGTGIAEGGRTQQRGPASWACVEQHAETGAGAGCACVCSIVAVE